MRCSPLQNKLLKEVLSGYGGGFVENPTYEQVCDKNTGHIELARIVFYPKEISYDELLEVFWKSHDPTTLNRQGADSGTQYRSVIFYHNAQQQQSAEQMMAQLSEKQVFDKAIVTQLSPVSAFYLAEEYHQGYFLQHPEQSYCQVVVAPKMAKFKQHYTELLKR